MKKRRNTQVFPLLVAVLLALLSVAWTPITHTITVHLDWGWGYKEITSSVPITITSSLAVVEMRHEDAILMQSAFIPDWEVVYYPYFPPSWGTASSQVTLTFALPYPGEWQEWVVPMFPDSEGNIHLSSAGECDVMDERGFCLVGVLQVEEEDECPVDPPPPTVLPTATAWPTPPLCPPTETPVPTGTFTPTPTVTLTPTSAATNTPTATATDVPTSTSTATPTPTLTDTPTSTVTPTPTPTPTIAATCVPTIDWQDQSTYTPVPPPPACREP